MFQGVTALLVRMLREDALRMRSHLARIGYLALTFFALLSTYFSMFTRSAAGMDYLRSLLILNFFFLVTVALGTYSSAIAEEREQGTLGLLKMTGVSRLAILLGKSTSWLLTTLGFMILQLPFIALAVTFGGVTLHQVWAATLALGSFAFLLCNFALLCSIICHTTRSASFVTGFWVGCYLVGPGIAGMILRSLSTADPTGILGRIAGKLSDVTIWIYDTSILKHLWSIMLTGYSANLFSFQFVSNLIGGICCFGLSWLLFEKCTLNLEPPVPRGSLLDISIGFRRRKAVNRISLRVWKRPFEWQQFHFAMGGSSRWILRWLIPPILAVSFLLSVILIEAWVGMPASGGLQSQSLREITTGLFAIVFWSSTIFFSFGSLNGSTRILGEDYREGTLSALLILPLRIRKIILARIRGEGFGLLPYISWMILSGGFLLLLQPQFFHINWNFLLEFLTVGYMTVACYLLAWHIAAWYSIHVKRGAIGLTIVTFYIGAMVMALGSTALAYFFEDWWRSLLGLRTREVLAAVLICLIPTAWIFIFHFSFFHRINRLVQNSGV